MKALLFHKSNLILSLNSGSLIPGRFFNASKYSVPLSCCKWETGEECLETNVLNLTASNIRTQGCLSSLLSPFKIFLAVNVIAAGVLAFLCVSMLLSSVRERRFPLKFQYCNITSHRKLLQSPLILGHSDAVIAFRFLFKIFCSLRIFYRLRSDNKLSRISCGELLHW